MPLHDALPFRPPSNALPKLLPTLRRFGKGDRGMSVSDTIRKHIEGVLVTHRRGFTRLSKGEVTHRWPQILPGGQAVLFTAAPNGVGMDNASVAAISLPGGVMKTLIAGYFGRYLPANGTRGYLVYLHHGMLSGLAFDPVR